MKTIDNEKLTEPTPTAPHPRVTTMMCDMSRTITSFVRPLVFGEMNDATTRSRVLTMIVNYVSTFNSDSIFLDRIECDVLNNPPSLVDSGGFKVSYTLNWNGEFSLDFTFVIQAEATDINGETVMYPFSFPSFP